MNYLEFIARETSHIPDKGQVMVRYYGLYANAHRGKVRKVDISPLALRMSEEEFKPVPSKGWAAMIRKVYEVDPMVCLKCGDQMKVIAFITNFAAVDRIIDHLKLTFVAEKPPPSHVVEQVALMAAEERTEYFFAIFVFLTSIRSRNYHLYAMGGFDSELFRKESRGARKSKFLSLEMKKRSIMLFIVSIIFLCFAIVYFITNDLSVAKFLSIFFSGVAFGASLASGIALLRRTK